MPTEQPDADADVAAGLIAALKDSTGAADLGVVQDDRIGREVLEALLDPSITESMVVEIFGEALLRRG